MTFSKTFIEESVDVLTSIDTDVVEQMAEGLVAIRERGGRLFILDVGGSAGHASHAVNGFRKICGFEAYTPTDNVSELTARANDEGWDTTFAEWLKGSQLSDRDALLVFSVGGGNAAKKVSTNLIAALQLGRERGGAILAASARSLGRTASPGRLAVTRRSRGRSRNRSGVMRLPAFCCRNVWFPLMSDAVTRFYPAAARHGQRTAESLVRPGSRGPTFSPG